MRGRFYVLGCIPLVLVAATALAEVRVVVEGIDGDELANVETRLTIRQQRERKDLDDTLVERLNAQAKRDIETALQPYGYYSPTIESELTGKAPNWTARYRIDAGEATRIGEVDVQLLGEGKDNAGFKDALRRIERRLKPEERLRHADYEDAKKQLADAAYASGFLDAHWEKSELRVNPEARQANIVLHMETGPRYLLGTVTLEQEGLDPEFIERYIVLKEGDVFDPQELLDQQFALGDLGYFQSVEIEPKRAEADAEHHVPVIIHTTPRNKHRYEAGVGYGTDTGARLSLGTEWRRINKYGHNLDADMRLSQIKNAIGANYRIPLGAEPGENISLSATTEAQQLESGDTSKYTIGASLNRSPGDWHRRLYVEFIHEESELGTTTTEVPNPEDPAGPPIVTVTKNKVTADLLTPGVSFTRTELDDPINARQGWYLFTDVHGAKENLLSNASFIRTYGLLRGVYSFDWRTRVLGRVELGANFHDDFSALPASQRFFAGGDQSVRGYDYQAIGTRNDDGDVIGGQYLTTASIELERRIKGSWGAAVFVDGGGADETFPVKMYYGAGLGLRYRAPVGTFSVDLAHPLTGEGDAQFLGLRLHIGVRVGL
ncbi:autotransporter assembly complex protein TamA [Hydrocarboniphaga effusa]|uniref:autotransporter assembly complex protein TamA n=1 Tax=Hydrocarboniphaga effusa TaxID=243629 RepID=UPI003BA98B16